MVWCGALLRPPRLTRCVPGREQLKFDRADPMVGGGGSSKIRQELFYDKWFVSACRLELVVLQFDRVASEVEPFDLTATQHRAVVARLQDLTVHKNRGEVHLPPIDAQVHSDVLIGRVGDAYLVMRAVSEVDASAVLGVCFANEPAGMPT